MLDKAPLLFRFHCGMLDDSMKTVAIVYSRDHLMEMIRLKLDMNILDIKFDEYIHDPRINWDTWIVLGKTEGSTYHYPIGFLNREPDWLQEEYEHE